MISRPSFVEKKIMATEKVKSPYMKNALRLIILTPGDVNHKEDIGLRFFGGRKMVRGISASSGVF